MARKIRRCRGPVNRLIMHRTKGLSGPNFQHAGGGVCIKGAGNYWAPGMPGSGPQAVYGVVIDPTTIQIRFTQCVVVSAVLGVEYQINGGVWAQATAFLEISSTEWQFTTGNIDPGDVISWRYIGGSNSIVDCEESEDIGDQGPIPVQNPLVLPGDFILLETGGMSIFLTEDDIDLSSGIEQEQAT